MFKKIRNYFWNNESGQGMVEYGLIIALVAVVAIVALAFVGDGLGGIFSGIAEKLGNSVPTT